MGSSLAGSAGPRIGRAVLLTCLLLALVASGLRIVHRLDPYFGTRVPHMHDGRIFLEQVRREAETGVLYQTDRPRFYHPGSHVYKFPPPAAAALKPLVPMAPKHGLRLLLAANLLAWCAFFALSARALRPTAPRLALLAVVLLNWEPFWESAIGPQLETWLTLWVALGFAGILWRRPWLKGLPLGVAGAFKVYPAFLLSYFAVRRQARVLVAGVVGAVLTFGGAALILPIQHTWVYFTQVLPGLGGTALAFYNVSGASVLGKIAIWALHGPAVLLEAGTHQMRVLEEPQFRTARILALIASAAALILLLGLVVRALRRASRRSDPRAEATGFCMTICLVLFAMPTSWVDYQTMLALPFMAAVAWAPPPREAPRIWALLGAVIVPLMFSLSFDWNSVWAGMLAGAMRAAIPLILVAVLIRILDRPWPGPTEATA